MRFELNAESLEFAKFLESFRRQGSIFGQIQQNGIQQRRSNFQKLKSKHRFLKQHSQMPSSNHLDDGNFGYFQNQVILAALN